MTHDTSSSARSPYVAIPRDLDIQPEWVTLSRDAQWLLLHLERDPYRLKCGVFVYNDRLVARAARATVDDVAGWWAELTGGGWIVEDVDSGEAWLTQHMRWDNTVANQNHAKAVLRDVKRIRSLWLAAMVAKVVYARWPALDPGELDPARDDRNGIPNAIEDGIDDGIPDLTPNPRSTKHVHPEPTPDPPGPVTPDPEPAPGARASESCTKCDGSGLVYGKGGESKLCSCQLKVVGE